MTLSLDWHSFSSHCFLNPCFPKKIGGEALEYFEKGRWKSHIWLTTSGTTKEKNSPFCWVGLSKEAILTSASAVNSHLEANKNDIWLNPLPFFHIGGLSIFARASLLDQKVIVFEKKWDSIQFVQALHETKATLTSLVPTQVYDLVEKNLKPTPFLRVALIGGAKLSFDLLQKGKALGWPLLPSYGLTEASSQVATAPLPSLSQNKVSLSILSHLDVKIVDERITLKGPSLFTCYVEKFTSSFIEKDPKIQGTFLTNDLGTIHHQTLKFLGRIDEIIKISGEKVNLSELEEKLEKVLQKEKIKGEFILIDFDDERLGKSLHLVTDQDFVLAEKVASLFKGQVLPFEKIRKIHCKISIPKTSLGKVKKKELKEHLKRPLHNYRQNDF